LGHWVGEKARVHWAALLEVEEAVAQQAMCDCTHCARRFQLERACVRSMEAAVVVAGRAGRMARDYRICTGRIRRHRPVRSLGEARTAEEEVEGLISKAVMAVVEEQQLV
jgi:hypothetical protein